MESVIRVDNLSKKFTRSLKRGMYYGSVDLGKSLLGLKVKTDEIRKGEFWALENINFDIKRGETFGILGRNGSGKSTLLRILNGIFPPDKGMITIQGKVGALIAVGAGFHPHMTGKENIFLNGTILGMTRVEIDKKLDQIIEFADIGDFIDAPVSTYSSGMTVRLGFSIAIHAEVDILLVDEVLAVGDVSFKRKSFGKILELQKKGVTTIFISHNLSQMEKLCQRALLVDKGKQIYLGDTRSAIEAYQELINKEDHVKKEKIGLGLVDIYNPRITNIEGNENIVSGDKVLFKFDYNLLKEIGESIQVRISLTDSAGRILQKFFTQELPLSTDRNYDNEIVQEIPEKGSVEIKLDDLKLFPGKYFFDVAFATLENVEHLGGIANFTGFIVNPKSGIYYDYSSEGIIDISHNIKVTKND